MAIVLDFASFPHTKGCHKNVKPAITYTNLRIETPLRTATVRWNQPNHIMSVCIELTLILGDALFSLSKFPWGHVQYLHNLRLSLGSRSVPCFAKFPYPRVAMRL